MKGIVGLVTLLAAILFVSGAPAEAIIVDFASTDIAHTLTGIVFTFSTTPPTETLTGASAAGTASCTGDGDSTSCSTNTTPVSASGSSPFGWTLVTSASTDTLQAGAGSFKPNGIVNSSIVAS